MKYTIQKLPKSQIEILFEIPAEELEKFKKEAILELGRELKVEGFRPGHIPEEIIEQKIGKMAILEESAEHAIRENYQRAVSESNIIPISQPQVEILKLAPQNQFEFKTIVFVLPEVNLPDYKKIVAGAKRKEVSVEAKEVEESLVWLQKSRAKFSLKNAPSQKGDFVEIEYSSPELEGGKTYKDAFILGDARFLPGFEENLEGLKDGQEKEFSVKFPENYSSKDLAAKEVVFKVRVKSVQKAEIPDLGDEFAKSLGNFENLDSLKKNIKDGIKLEKDREERARMRAEMLDKISEQAVCEIPDILIESEKNRMLEELKDRILQSFQMPFGEYLAKIKKTEKELLETFSEPAKKRTKNSLVLKEIGKRENIEVSQAEIAEEVDKFLKRYPDIKTAEKEFDPQRLEEYTKEVIANEKIFKLLEGYTK